MHETFHHSSFRASAKPTLNFWLNSFLTLLLNITALYSPFFKSTSQILNMIYYYRSRRSARRSLLVLCSVVVILGLGRRFTLLDDSVSFMSEQGTQAMTLQPRILRYAHDVWVSVENDKKRLGEHTYRDDGLLEVNPMGEHPIFELIRVGEEAWTRKLNKASRTLGQAVQEYQRRYGRHPPLGFDKW